MGRGNTYKLQVLEPGDGWEGVIFTGCEFLNQEMVGKGVILTGCEFLNQEMVGKGVILPGSEFLNQQMVG